MKRIKIFLGGFVNATNSQNLNCRELALRLDKSKFDVYTLNYFDGKLLPIAAKEKVHKFNCFWPGRISVHLGFLWGIWHADIVYLPRADFWKWNRFLLNFFGRKSFKTIEGILDEDNLKSSIDILGSYASVMAEKNSTDLCFPITNFLGDFNRKHHPLIIEQQVLYLGCDTTLFKNKIPKDGNLKTVIFIGRLLRRKGVYDYLAIAKKFPKLAFKILGDGEERERVETYINENKLFNVELLGVLNHEEMAQTLAQTDLHILPSRSEGFPKVTLETAAAGVPSIVYSDYGAEEWIKSGENGWVVNTVEEINAILEHLIENPSDLQKVANGAVKLAADFDWEIKIKDWEEVIFDIYSK